ncbi:MAG TPA: hypothetical protein VGF97_04235 [Rhizomicrobium sp.]|jgi:hypothetical protein
MIYDAFDAFCRAFVSTTHVDGNGVADSLTGVWKVDDRCMYQIDLQIQ